MSLTVIAMTGILVGFLCLAVGFFIEEGSSRSVTTNAREKRVRRIRRRVVERRRKAA